MISVNPPSNPEGRCHGLTDIRKLRQGKGKDHTAREMNQNPKASLEKSKDKCQSVPQLTFLQPHLPQPCGPKFWAGLVPVDVWEQYMGHPWPELIRPTHTKQSHMFHPSAPCTAGGQRPREHIYCSPGSADRRLPVLPVGTRKDLVPQPQTTDA